MSPYLSLAVASLTSALLTVLWLGTVFLAQTYSAVLRMARNGWIVLLILSAAFLVAHSATATLADMEAAG